MATLLRARRRVKVRGGNLGPFLCWAVVFADIGTSVYYVPGILHGQFGTRSAIFVGMTLVVFIFLTVKYAEVAWRYPEGGGVVTVASRAIHPFAGLLGGLFILVDYYLTAALSALSGVFYLAVVAPALTGIAVNVTIAALVVLGILNVLGIRESAAVSAVFAVVAAVGQLLVLIFVAFSLGLAGIVHSFQALAQGPHLTPIVLVTGYSAAFLAFSGLESIAQIAPAMRESRREVAYKAMAAVVLTIAITSPLLTLWSTTILNGTGADPNQFISLLGARVSGPVLGDFVAVGGSLLLIFASNTAIIGSYHVFMALARMGFLPRLLEKRNRLRRTPHWAILASVVPPVILVAVSSGNVNFLGDLYAFGLLGAFFLTCLGLDIVRWRERRLAAPSLRTLISFGVGVLTTLAVLVGWTTNLVAKPQATEFGGGLTVFGLIVGLVTYGLARGRRPAVFPLPFQPRRAAASIAEALRGRPADILVIIPHDPDTAAAVIGEAARVGAGHSTVFLYRGDAPLVQESELMEVTDPYLRDYGGQEAFARAESLTRKLIPDRRYIYVPGNLRREVIGEIWKQVSPKETIIAEGQHELLPTMALDRVRRHHTEGVAVLHLISARLRALAAG